MPSRRLTPIFVVIMLIAVACGSDATSTDASPTAADEPAIASMCEEGVVDCDDTVDRDDIEPTGSDDEPAVSSGVLVNGGLTVEEALRTDATGVLAVKGFLVADQTTIRLCDLLAESLPPQCGGASVTVDVASIDELTFDDEVPLESAQGVTWTNATITLLGELVDEHFVPALAAA